MATRREGRSIQLRIWPLALALAACMEARAPSRTAIGSEAAGASPFWQLLAQDAEWRRLPGDSLGLSFSNELSATVLVVAHDGARLRGTARFRFQPESDPYPVLEVRGRRADCGGPS